jgi:two-component system, NarL family, invasion response regulator UvrY
MASSTSTSSGVCEPAALPKSEIGMKILIVDDHVTVRKGVRWLLAAFPEILADDVPSAIDAIAAFRNDRPDVVLLDLNLPDSSGLEVLRCLLREDKAANVLIFSAHAEPLYVSRALEAGANGYISKGASAEELVTAIRCVGRGGRYVEREIAARIVFMPHPSEDPLQRLTTREVDILRLLGQGKTLTAISDACGMTYKGVSNCCTAIKQKLGVAHTAELIRLSIEMREGR